MNYNALDYEQLYNLCQARGIKTTNSNYKRLRRFELIRLLKDSDLFPKPDMRTLAVALAAVRYCRWLEIDLTDLIPEYFEDEPPITSKDYDMAIKFLAS